ncbi:L,D-transpeptidase [Propionispora vibrioides]|jgi:lipoprotein-anchoring transpeptidase ErfK/SrfK|uniref:L,D-transpeptidase catalytic domain n=1 Tax=Propionispora vibrioides TaxID=112903 RepID=A0A1H8XX86_9FIRM|nr:L,D-transpeptidase [Propionispora vibrioides]SEP44499.1 L,D-transpeptidase catalytic domain [Propionispora vibrioides]
MEKYVVVHLTTHRACYFENDQLIKEYRVGSGKSETPTPPGSYKVVEKLVFKNQGDIDFGSRRLVLSSDRTCLHGSWNGPVEGYVSGGCVRMYNPDIEELFEKVDVGTPVIMI